MACMKLGSKPDAFQRQGQAWFCATGLPSDIIVEVGEMSFHLHKFPLLSRSGLMERMISDAPEKGEESSSLVHLPKIPGGARTFELVAKFCYGVKLELTASNIVSLRCAAEHLEMSEEYGEGNLIERTESFLSQTVLINRKDSIKALQTCDDVLSYADDLNITERCIESLAAKAESESNALGWPLVGPGQSPGGTIMWNGIKVGDCDRNLSSGWWYEDVSTLSFGVYKRLILAMENHGVRLEVISGSLMSYAKKYLSGLNRRKDSANPSTTRISEHEQRNLLEEIDELLPMQKDLVPTKFLFGLLRTAIILKSSSSSISNLEKRIGLQLNQATLDDLLIPTFCHSMETLYNVDCVQRILDHFLAVEGAASPCFDDVECVDEHSIGSGSLTPITMVAKLIDGYLAEVASDINLKLPKFEALAGAVPDFARPLDDGLYRAIDIYLKSHPWLSDVEREHLCRLLDCQKLSIEACTHAAQNERLPIRVIVQVLFFEQLQLRTSIAGCLMVSDNLDRSRPLLGGGSENTEDGWATATNENQVLKVGMDGMRTRVLELEKECTNMRREIENLGRVKGSRVVSSGGGWANVSKRFGFGFKLKSQMCNAQEDAVSDRSRRGEKNEKKRH